MDTARRKKLSDIFCDLGKYLLTTVLFGYFFADKEYTFLIVIIATFFGITSIILGLYLAKDKKKVDILDGTKHKVTVLENTTFRLERIK